MHTYTDLHTYVHNHLPIYRHTGLQTYRHTDIHIIAYAYIDTYMHTCMQAGMQTCSTQAYMHACMPADGQTDRHTYFFACMHTYIIDHNCVHAYIHIYMHTLHIHTHMHACVHTHLQIYMHAYVRTYFCKNIRTTYLACREKVCVDAWVHASLHAHTPASKTKLCFWKEDVHAKSQYIH